MTAAFPRSTPCLSPRSPSRFPRFFPQSTSAPSSPARARPKPCAPRSSGRSPRRVRHPSCALTRTRSCTSTPTPPRSSNPDNHSRLTRLFVFFFIFIFISEKDEDEEKDEDDLSTIIVPLQMKTRFAFVGFRHSHAFDLFNLVRDRPDCEIVASCEEDPATRKTLAADGRAKITHEKYERMLDEAECDAGP